jgi:hypothetical protein
MDARSSVLRNGRAFQHPFFSFVSGPLVLKDQILLCERRTLACAKAHIRGRLFFDLVMGALSEASGRKMRFTGMSFMRLENGKIVEEIELADGVTASSQLGFIRLPVWPA